jgi:hypothetical protein
MCCRINSGIMGSHATKRVTLLSIPDVEQLT